ncbi:MAG TPA: hypothetical protein VNB24_01345 [Acidimicrobiales bacterium]|nr:hypothetical protein [Acidimicrobiales bacterium]
MKTPTKILVTSVCLLAAVAAPAHAGSQASPEFTDPAGDVPLLVVAGENADWADLTGAWLEPITGGMRLKFETVGDASAPDEDLSFSFSFDILAGQEEHCYFSVDGYNTEGDEFLHYGPRADLSYVCQGEKQPFTIPFTQVSVELSSLWNAALDTPAFDAAITSVDIPFSAFTEGKVPSLLVAGTGVQPTSASTQILTDHGFLLGDRNESCTPSYTPPFDFASGCPDPAGVFVIGS